MKGELKNFSDYKKFESKLERLKNMLKVGQRVRLRENKKRKSEKDTFLQDGIITQITDYLFVVRGNGRNEAIDYASVLCGDILII